MVSVPSNARIPCISLYIQKNFVDFTVYTTKNTLVRKRFRCSSWLVKKVWWLKPKGQISLNSVVSKKSMVVKTKQISLISVVSLKGVVVKTTQISVDFGGY